ncbi:MAG: ATP-binding protein [Luteibaculum sp.]
MDAQEFSFYKRAFNSNFNQAFVYDLLVDENHVLWAASSEGVLRASLNHDTLLVHSASSERTNFSTALVKHDRSIYAGYFDGSVWEISGLSIQDSLFYIGRQVNELKFFEASIYAQSSELLVAYNLENKQLDTVFHSTDSEITDFELVPNGVLISTRNGLYYKENGKASQLILEEEVLNISRSENKVWFITFQAIYQFEDNKPTEYLKLANELDASSVEDLLFIPFSNRFWLATNTGLKLVNRRGMVEQAKGLVSNLGAAINSLVLDKEALWLGTYGEGVWFAMPNAAPVWYDQIKDFKQEGEFWVASTQNTLYWGIEQPEFKATDSLQINSRVYFLPRKDGNFWLVEKGSLYQVKNGSKNLIVSKLPNSELLAFEQLDTKTLAISFRFLGLYIINVEDKAIQKIWNTRNGMLHNDITQVLNWQEKGELWCLSRESGISIISNQTVSRYVTASEGLQSMENTAMALYRGEVWVSSEGGGLTVIDRNYNTQAVRLNEGSAPEYFYGLAADSNLLVYSRTHLYSVSPQRTLKFEIPQYAQSVIPFEGRAVNGKSSYWIKCYRGYLRIPKNTFSFLQEPILLKIQSASSDISGEIEPGTSLPNGKHELRIQFELSSSNPLASKSVEYKLEGYHNRWQQSNKDEVLLSSVRYGDYELFVRVSGKEYPVLAFSVNPPFWRQPWFIASLFFIIIVAYVLLLRWRTLRLKRRNEELEVIVAERTADLAKKNKELQQFTYAISHDLKNPAANITELITALREDVANPAEEVEFYLKQLEKASGKLYQNLLDLLEVLKHANSGELPTEDVDIKEQIEDIRDKISNQISSNNAQIELNLEHFNSLVYNKVNLHSILYNLISNGIKYRRKEEDPIVRISSFETNKHYGLRIQDNGLGIDLEKNKDMLFGLFKRFHSHVEGSGVGLYLVNAIIEKNGGFIELESEPGKGSTFSLHLVPKAGVA